MVLLDLQSLELSGRDHDCGCDDNDGGSFLSLLLCSH
ncbi:MAG TPA: SapB/AmfS family lanthipeptide [Pseudonocardiaceae bacterium]|jgi:hypothetical protein